jgi:hypothetical protein
VIRAIHAALSAKHIHIWEADLLEGAYRWWADPGKPGERGKPGKPGLRTIEFADSVLLSGGPEDQAEPARPYALGKSLRARQIGGIPLWPVTAAILNTMAWYPDGPGLRLKVRHDHILRMLAQEDQWGWAPPSPDLPTAHTQAQASTDSAIEPQPNDPPETWQQLELTQELVAFRRSNPDRTLQSGISDAETALYDRARHHRHSQGFRDVLNILRLSIPRGPQPTPGGAAGSPGAGDAAGSPGAGMLDPRLRPGQPGPSAAQVPAPLPGSQAEVARPGDSWLDNPWPDNPWPDNPWPDNPWPDNPWPGDPGLGDPRLGDPGLGDPRLGDPGLGDPWLGYPWPPGARPDDPGLDDPGLDDPWLDWEDQEDGPAGGPQTQDQYGPPPDW